MEVKLCHCLNSFVRDCRRFREAYTGLPVVRVTEKQKALNCVVLNCSIPVNFFKSGVTNTI